MLDRRFLLESPSPSCWGNSNNSDSDCNNSDSHFRSLVNSLVSQQQHAASWAPSALKRFSLDKELRMMLAKALSGNSDPLLLSSSVLERGSVEEIYPSISYETPGFARSIFPLLEDLYSIFGDLLSHMCRRCCWM